MNKMAQGAADANAESDRMAHARALGDATGKLLAALNSLPTEADVRRIVREELERAMRGYDLSGNVRLGGAPDSPIKNAYDLNR